MTREAMVKAMLDEYATARRRHIFAYMRGDIMDAEYYAGITTGIKQIAALMGAEISEVGVTSVLDNGGKGTIDVWARIVGQKQIFTVTIRF